jgi:hypothetical protein
MKLPAVHNPIRVFAVICVAVTSAFVMYMSYLLIQILSSPEWCGKALQAEKISSQNFGGLTACIDLLKIQLKSLANNSYIFGVVTALCLLTLNVIVIAGGRLSFAVSKTGATANMGKEDVEAIPVEVTNSPAAPVPTIPVPTAQPELPPTATGPAMPEPKP